MLSHINPFWRGQLFLFDAPKATLYNANIGNKLLLIFLFMEGIVRPSLLFGSRYLAIVDQTWWMWFNELFYRYYRAKGEKKVNQISELKL